MTSESQASQCSQAATAVTVSVVRQCRTSQRAAFHVNFTTSHSVRKTTAIAATASRSLVSACPTLWSTQSTPKPVASTMMNCQFMA